MKQKAQHVRMDLLLAVDNKRRKAFDVFQVDFASLGVSEKLVVELQVFTDWQLNIKSYLAKHKTLDALSIFKDL